jgi:pimeloyl-ACP methyl ester carboxylesterase
MHPTVFIHGAFSAPSTFNYFREVHKWKDEIVIKYDSSERLLSVLHTIRHEILNKSQGPVNIVGHSLGGVLGIALSNTGLNVNKIVTLSAPIGGIGSFWPPKTIGYELKKLVKHTQSISIPHQFYVTCSGNNPWLLSRNDGVVSIASQMSIENANYIPIESNHFEILMNKNVLKNIVEFFQYK